jgi:N-methylhydantoinase B/oxoprolinase/acetone carboxylase alpha subunit
VLLAGHARRTTMTWAVERERGRHHTRRDGSMRSGTGATHAARTCVGVRCTTVALDRAEGPAGRAPSAGRATGHHAAHWPRRATPTAGQAGAPAGHDRAQASRAHNHSEHCAGEEEKRESRGGGERGRKEAHPSDEPKHDDISDTSAGAWIQRR